MYIHKFDLFYAATGCVFDVCNQIFCFSFYSMLGDHFEYFFFMNFDQNARFLRKLRKKEPEREARKKGPRPIWTIYKHESAQK